MKNSTNYYELKKGRGIQPTKKTNYLNSILYKEVNPHLNEVVDKIKNNRESR